MIHADAGASICFDGAQGCLTDLSLEVMEKDWMPNMDNEQKVCPAGNRWMRLPRVFSYAEVSERKKILVLCWFLDCL